LLNILCILLSRLKKDKDIVKIYYIKDIE